MDSSIQIEETAAAWLARRDSDDWSEADETALAQWLQASTANRVAFIRLESAWQQTQRLKALGAGVPRGTVPSPGEWRRSPFLGRSRSVPDSAVVPPSEPRRAPMLRRFAAGILVVAALGAGWQLWPRGSSYHTEVGGLAAVPMSDGSKVTLNTNSGIRVAISVTERRVELEQGEAFFEVAKDSKRPFIVSVGDKRIIAIGTKFSVKREADDVRVVVTEGRVRVTSASRKIQEPVTQLSAGSIARASDAGVLVQERSLPEAEEYLSWRAGFVIFHETPLADAVAEFNRYNTRKLVIDDPTVAGIRIGGHFRSNNVDAFVRLLQSGFPIHAEQRDEQILLTSQ